MVLGELESYMQKHETHSPTNTIPKNKLKMDKRLKCNRDTIKILEENIGRKISDIPHSNIFTEMSPRARDIKERINKWYYIKLKRFCTAKENISKIKGNQLYGRTYLSMIPWTRVCSPRYIKNSSDSTPGRQAIELKNGQRTWTDTSTRRTYGWPIDIWKMLNITNPQRNAN